MICEFCGTELPTVFASKEDDAFHAIDRVRELCPDGNFVYDADDHVVFEYFSANVVPSIEGYRFLCLRCANKLSEYSEKLLNKHDSIRETYIKNTALNAVRKHRGKTTTPYMVAFDLGIERHPVAQVFKKENDGYRFCKQLDDEAAGILLNRFEG